MRKIRSYVVLISMAASVSLLAACSDNEPEEVADTDAGVEAPLTDVPPATTTPPPATTTPPATAPDPVTPEPDAP